MIKTHAVTGQYQHIKGKKDMFKRFFDDCNGAQKCYMRILPEEDLTERYIVLK